MAPSSQKRWRILDHPEISDESDPEAPLLGDLSDLEEGRPQSSPQIPFTIQPRHFLQNPSKLLSQPCYSNKTAVFLPVKGSGSGILPFRANVLSFDDMGLMGADGLWPAERDAASDLFAEDSS
jgi:hypothetical protein